MIVFQIEKAGRNVRIGNLKVWFYVTLYGRIKLGDFGDSEYFAFKCPKHGLVIDMEHGYMKGWYYHLCAKCGYKLPIRPAE